MTGPEHYQAAEKCLELVDDDSPHSLALLAEGQLHATLALAAVTALGTRPSSVAQMKAWAAAIGDPYGD